VFDLNLLIRENVKNSLPTHQPGMILRERQKYFWMQMKIAWVHPLLNGIIVILIHTN